MKYVLLKVYHEFSNETDHIFVQSSMPSKE